MRIGRIPDQVVRLVVLFVAVIAVMVVARRQFVPESFGELGHYRTDAIDIVTAQQLQFAGLESCADCHDYQAEAKAASYHRGLTCEGCHGAALAHAEDPMEQQPLVQEDRAACLRCHGYLAARPTGFPQVLESIHNPMEPCKTCHDPHDPTPPETPSTCGACHGEIARTKAVSHHWSLDCETCHDTPAQHHVSPRTFRPDKPTQREFCGQCHGEDAVASAIPRVDVATHGGRYTCWQCHYPHYPEGQ